MDAIGQTNTMNLDKKLTSISFSHSRFHWGMLYELPSDPIERAEIIDIMGELSSRLYAFSGDRHTISIRSDRIERENQSEKLVHLNRANK